MESIQIIKQHIKSVKNINQITKAMELVAATKMRKSEEVTLAARPYSFLALDLLASLSKIKNIKMPALFSKRNVQKTAVVVVTSDKGLAGAFNSTILKKVDEFIKQSQNEKDEKIFIAVGKKAANYLSKFNLAERFLKFGDFIELSQIKPLADFLINGFLNYKWDKIIVFSMHFKSVFKQEVFVKQILPISFESLKETLENIIPETGKFSEFKNQKQLSVFKDRVISEYLIEPSPEKILDELAKHLVLIEIYQLILEANSSEHAARRFAMKNASENAEKLSFNLSLIYNKARQNAITKEIVEIVSGAEALNN